MKLIFHLVALVLPVVSFGQASVQLVGIVNLPDGKQALLDLSMAVAGNPVEQVTLREGERRGHVELLKIRPDGDSAEVRWHGSNVVLKLVQPRPSTDPVSITFSNTSLMSVLKVFSILTNRTLLQHPALPNVRLTLTTNAHPQAAARAIAGALREQGIACVAYGQKFVKIVPAKLTESDPGTPPPPVSDSALERETLPAGAIDLISVPANQAAMIYAALANRQMNTSQPSANFPYIGPLKSTTPLTRAEILHALDIQFAWNGAKMVAMDDKTMKLVPLRGP